MSLLCLETYPCQLREIGSCLLEWGVEGCVVPIFHFVNQRKWVSYDERTANTRSMTKINSEIC